MVDKVANILIVVWVILSIVALVAQVVLFTLFLVGELTGWLIIVSPAIAWICLLVMACIIGVLCSVIISGRVE